ncbi:MAG: alanine dehydrogenase [Sedimentisphaerales bacterium]|nr:alanine dehydrogenase [Sedimentisphaerales bacterium]
MTISVPKEIKNNENRVALTPDGAQTLIEHGHKVCIETNAGLGSGFVDQQYQAAGAKILPSAADVYKVADMVLKVKEPLPEEYDLLGEDSLLFTYLHLAAADPELTNTLLAKQITGIAYETVQLANGHLPLLQPMSEVAGRVAVQVGVRFLEKSQGGSGILLGGVPGVAPAEVVIVGGGTVGTNAAQMAMGLGARVTIIDKSAERLAYLDNLYQGRLTTLMSNRANIARAVQKADLLIGAVLIPGAKCPHLVTEEMVKTMKSGSVIVDVAIDQGGSIETIDRVTTHSNPTYVKHGVVHYAVANMPGVVPRTSTLALTNVTFPYALELAGKGVVDAVTADAALAKGVNTLAGHCTHPAVAEALGLLYCPLHEALPEHAKDNMVCY